MKFLTRDQALGRMRLKGHVVFDGDSRDLNLNIIGIRGKSAKVDDFGCQLMLAWKYKGIWSDRSFNITTYPGPHYLITKLLNPAGAAILVPGQYRGVYAIRKHAGKYNALCQTYGDVKVFRDANRDYIFDLNPQTIMSGSYGINIHRSINRGCLLRVGAHSAGCQVFSCVEDFVHFMELVRGAAKLHGNKFTYTLINE